MSNDLIDVENIILAPEKRIQQLSMLSSKIELNTNIAARKFGFTINMNIFSTNCYSSDWKIKFLTPIKN